jgi:hypothetical protein
MAGHDTDSPPLPVALFTDDPKLRARAASLRCDGWRMVHAPTGYEAAAEILAADAAALLVDLRALTANHQGLLGLAREKGVPAFGIAGPVPTDMAARIGELRPVEVEDVPAILASLGRMWARADADEPAPQATPAGEDECEQAPEPTPDHEAGPAGVYESEPADEPAPPRPDAPAQTDAAPTTTPQPDAPTQPDAPAPAPKKLGGLLTDDEIASLLEDGP